jgi:hypothetical protein
MVGTKYNWNRGRYSGNRKRDYIWTCPDVYTYLVKSFEPSHRSTSGRTYGVYNTYGHSRSYPIKVFSSLAEALSYAEKLYEKKTGV